MWMLSKCVHMAGVGLLSRPWTKVSQARRKLKSSGTNGSGIGNSGSNASRSRIALTPTAVAANPLRRANRAKTLSTRAKPPAPRPGQANAHAIAITIKPNSIPTNVMFGLLTESSAGAKARSLFNAFPARVNSRPDTKLAHYLAQPNPCPFAEFSNWPARLSSRCHSRPSGTAESLPELHPVPRAIRCGPCSSG